MIIKWVEFGLSHLVEYPYLNTTQTRHANSNWHIYCTQEVFGLASLIIRYLRCFFFLFFYFFILFFFWHWYLYMMMEKKISKLNAPSFNGLVIN